jgi:hypothetical protein
MQNEDKLAKLIKRIDLDRPILAQEKMKFIMMEQKDDAATESTKNTESKAYMQSQSLMQSGSIAGPGGNSPLMNPQSQMSLNSPGLG